MYSLWRTLRLSLIITLLFYIPFTVMVLKNDIERETSREIIQTETIASEIKNVLLQDEVHRHEEESMRIGQILPTFVSYTNDTYRVLVDDEKVLFEKTSRAPSYIDIKLIETTANAVANKRKNQYLNNSLQATSVKVEKRDGHFRYKMIYKLNHGNHQDSIIIERDLTELYAKPIHNTLIYGGLTFVFLYFAIVGISHLIGIWKLRDFKRVIREQQRMLASGSKNITNVGREHNRFLEEVSEIMINLHNRAQEVYIANKNVLQDISHATSSRLTEIKQSVDLIRYYGMNDRQQVEPLLGRISEAATTISSIQSMFMDLARVENPESTGTPTVYNVQELINFAIDGTSKQYPGIDFIQTGTNREKFLNIQREHFLLVMRTLLGNAVKYSVDSDKIVIEVLDKSEYKGYVAIRVTNWGSYIPVEERERIFERYYRGVNARQNKSGIGLGLHIVKKVMEVYEGEIKVESDLTGETSFTVVFPNNDDRIG